MSAVRSLRADWMEFPIHFLTATIGGTCLYILLTIATGLAVHPLGIRLPDYTPIFDPFVWLAGLLLGAYLNRSRRHRSACFVGVLGVILLGLLMLREVLVIKHSPGFNRRIGGHYWEYAYDHMLSPHNKNPDGEEYLGKVLFTTPALLSVAYSIGAWLTLQYSKANGLPGTPQASDPTTDT